MHLEKISFKPEQYPDRSVYPFNLPLFNKPLKIPLSLPVTFFIGENGTGKSTLLEAIALRCSIHIWRNESKTRFQNNPYEQDLYRFIDIGWVNGPVSGSFFGSETFRDFSRCLDEWAVADPGILGHFGGRSLITQSHGQSIMSLFRKRYRIKGLYLLDEPETALSPRSQLELLKIIKTTSEEGHAQFIIASHSPILLACPGSQIYCFDNDNLQCMDYEDTEYYKVYRDFMMNRDKYLS